MIFSSEGLEYHFTHMAHTAALFKLSFQQKVLYIIKGTKFSLSEICIYMYGQHDEAGT